MYLRGSAGESEQLYWNLNLILGDTGLVCFTLGLRV